MYTINNTKVTKKTFSGDIYIYIYLYVFIGLRYIYIYVYGWCREGKGWAKGEGNKATLSGVVLNKSSQARKKIINVLIRRLPPRPHHGPQKTTTMQLNKCNHSSFSKEGSMPRQSTEHAAHVHKECPAFWGREKKKRCIHKTHTSKISHRSCHSGCSSLWKKLLAWRHNPTQYAMHALLTYISNCSTWPHLPLTPLPYIPPLPTDQKHDHTWKKSPASLSGQ